MQYPRWTQRILVEPPNNPHHFESRLRGGETFNGIRSEEDEFLNFSSLKSAESVDTQKSTHHGNFLMRRAKTDLSELDLENLDTSLVGRSRLPIFVSNENARLWLDLNSKSNSLDALDNEHHYVNVAPSSIEVNSITVPPRPPKCKLDAKRSTPVYVNVYSLGRRKPGDVIQSGR